MSTMTEPPRAKPLVERRTRRARVAADIVYREGSARGSVELVDISATGAKIESHLLLQPETYIWLKLPGLEAWRAKIVWVESFRAGCEFEHPLHPAVFERVVDMCRARPRG